MDTVIVAQLVVGLLALVTATVGSIGGLGGAVLLVPALVLLGWSPTEAAPVGIAMSAAGALAAVPRQSLSGLTNYRLGVSLEIAASAAAAAGALISVLVAPRALQFILGASAIVAAVVGAIRTGQRNRPVEGADLGTLRDRPGHLASAYPDELGRVIPYSPVRLPLGLTLMGGAGAIAGLTGVSGGFIKTPVMSEAMHVPVKVAGATSLFMVGVTASVALAVYASQGRVTSAIAPAVIGGIIGGRLGASIQPRLPAAGARRFLSLVLVAVGTVLVVLA